MAKKKAKGAKKKKSVKKTSAKKSTVGKKAEKLNDILIENFVGLQKAMTNLTVKFDSLADQISKLLQLFEISAKSFAEKLSTGAPQIEKDKEFLDKLNALLEQNKVIARGLTLMEDKMKERVYGGGVARHPQPAAPAENYAPSLDRRRFPPQY